VRLFGTIIALVARKTKILATIMTLVARKTNALVRLSGFFQHGAPSALKTPHAQTVFPRLPR